MMNGSYPPPRRRPPQQNMPSHMLNDHENNNLYGMLGRKCITLATGVVQVLLAKHMNQWQRVHTGPCCFVKDSTKRSYFFRVYNLRSGQMVWEQEFYTQFRYNAPRPYFLTFDADNCRAALNFASRDEAHDFMRILDEKIRQKQEKKQARHQQSMRGASTSQHPQPGGYSSQVQQPHQVSSQPQQYNFQHSTGVTEVKSTKVDDKKSKKKNKKSKISKSDIGLPSDFKHLSHVGWDPNKGFDMNNIDPDTRQFFAEAGVTEKDMQDQAKRQFIYDFIEKQGGIDAVRRETRRSKAPLPPSRSGPPPPPPARGGPPPPPQRAIGSSRAPPPPQRQPPSTIGRSTGPPAPPPSRYNPPMHSYSPPHPTVAPPAPGGVPPPPPPPPPPSVGAPPPPPAPAAPAMGASLQSQIQQGMDLKAVGDKPAPSSGRDALLEAIRRGKDLKSVSSDQAIEKPPPTPTDEGDSLANALARALQKRENAIHTDSESDDSDDEDDDEWSD